MRTLAYTRARTYVRALYARVRAYMYALGNYMSCAQHRALRALLRARHIVTYGYLLADPPRRYRIEGWLDANEMRTSGAVRDEGTLT